MTKLHLILAVCLGVGLGAAAIAACWTTSPMPLPCQSTNRIHCPGDCTPVIDYAGTRYSDCTNVDAGCCQWMVETFRCVGGSCGSSCSWITAPHEFTHYKATSYWVCTNLGPPYYNRVCKYTQPDDPPGGGD